MKNSRFGVVRTAQQERQRENRELHRGGKGQSLGKLLAAALRR